jgi:hypothetical protein
MTELVAKTYLPVESDQRVVSASQSRKRGQSRQPVRASSRRVIDVFKLAETAAPNISPKLLRRLLAI